MIIITKLSLAEQISKNVFTAQYKIEDRRRPQKVVSKRFKSPYWLNTSGLIFKGALAGHTRAGAVRSILMLIKTIQPDQLI